MIIRTQRLEIRPLEGTDLEDLFSIYGDEDTCRYLLHDAWTKDNRNSCFENLLKKNDLSGPGLYLACILDERVIGTLSASYTDMKDTVEIGYVLNKEYKGKGYAYEAVKAMMDRLFEAYEVHRIITNMDARNSDSAKLCESLGMRREAHFLKDYWNKGEWTDSFIYAVLKEEWKK